MLFANSAFVLFLSNILNASQVRGGSQILNEYMNVDVHNSHGGFESVGRGAEAFVCLSALTESRPLVQSAHMCTVAFLAKWHIFRAPRARETEN